jgi:hypothetical protein
MQLSKYIDLASIAYSSSSPVIEIDTANCEGVLFIAVPGTTVARTGALSLKTAASTTATFVAVSSTHTMTSTGATRDVLVMDVYKPVKRWIQATYASTADSETRMLAFKYGLRTPPVAFSATAVTNLSVPIVLGGIKRVVSPSSAT